MHTSPIRQVLLVLAVVVLAVACGDTAPSSSPTDGRTTATTGAPTGTPAGTLTGTLQGDAQLEGGCAWLVTTGGPDADVADQVMPVFPEGHTIEFEPELRVLGPQGETVAAGGQELVVEGAPLQDMATTCQVGPPYRVDEVLGTVDDG